MAIINKKSLTIGNNLLYNKYIGTPSGAPKSTSRRRAFSCVKLFFLSRWHHRTLPRNWITLRPRWLRHAKSGGEYRFSKSKLLAGNTNQKGTKKAGTVTKKLRNRIAASADAQGFRYRHGKYADTIQVTAKQAHFYKHNESNDPVVVAH